MDDLYAYGGSRELRQQIAIRPCPCHLRGAKRIGGAWLVLDDDWMRQVTGCGLGQGAHGNVGGTAGWEGDDQADGLGRKGRCLGMCDGRHSECRGQKAAAAGLEQVG